MPFFQPQDLLWILGAGVCFAGLIILGVIISVRLFGSMRGNG